MKSSNIKKQNNFLADLLVGADQGDADAQFNLGVSHDEGIGVAPDYKEAVKWWRLSADQGDAAAQFNLGYMFWLFVFLSG